MTSPSSTKPWQSWRDGGNRANTLTLPKQILFYSLLLLLTLAGVEGMARAAYYLAYGEWYRPPPPPRQSVQR